jgi:hypothetical protein
MKATKKINRTITIVLASIFSMALMANQNNTKNKIFYEEVLTVINEEEIAIESWMYDVESFEKALVLEGMEQEMELEAWMQEEMEVSAIMLEEMEQGLEVEAWMQEAFVVETIVNEAAEPELEIEDWMLDF